MKMSSDYSYPEPYYTSKIRFRYKDSNRTTWENDPKGVEN